MTCGKQNSAAACVWMEISSELFIAIYLVLFDVDRERFSDENFVSSNIFRLTAHWGRSLYKHHDQWRYNRANNTSMISDVIGKILRFII